MSRFIRSGQQLLLALSIVGILVPRPAVILAAQVESGARQPQTVLVDVALAGHGRLQGQFLDANGQPITDSTVQLHNGRALIAQAKTDAGGHFQFENVQGGVYAVVSPQASTGIRAWAPNTAPPSASQGILLVGGTAERANLFVNTTGLSLIVVGGIITTTALVASLNHSGS
jgi:hypothetical protein